MKHLNPVAIVLLSLLLISCKSLQKMQRPIANDWNHIKSWSFNGKIAINDGIDSGSGRISWKTNINNTQLKFKAPLGQGRWEINETPEKSTLISSKNGLISAPTTDLLIEKELGWTFPWDALKYWIRGYKHNEELKKHTILPKGFYENEWHITYSQWMDTPMGFLPKKLKATKPPYSIKVIIYQWNIQ